MSILSALAFFTGIALMAITPFPILYILSDITAFLLRRVFKYRWQTIHFNISNAFPSMSKSEKKRVVGLVYKNIADVLLEGLKSFSMTHKQVLKRHKVINQAVIEPYIAKKQNLIGLTGHYANWEWGSLSAKGQINAKTVALYKALSNPIIDRFVRWNRAKFGTTLAPITKTMETFEKHMPDLSVFIMAADQSPTKRGIDNSRWVDFFGLQLPFLHGPEKYAKLYNLPVFYIHINRLRRGYYEIELSLLIDNPKNYANGEITQLYARKLEEVIRSKPEDWLWSHKRWRYAKKCSSSPQTGE